MSGGLLMSENVNDRLHAQHDQQENDASTAAVLTLRQARERAGLHLAALAAMLKVPVRRLEALEAGRYDELPDMTFARALALSVCRVLKVDPAPILASLPASAEVRLGDIERSINAPMPQRQAPLKMGGGSTPLVGRRLPWPMAFALLALVVAVVLWFLLPSASSPPAQRTTLTPVAVEPLPAEGEAVGTGASTDEAPVESGDASAAALPDASAAAASDAPAVAAPEGVFRLRARETSWVQVSGASGRVLLQRSLQAGEVVAFSTDFPLAVVIGRADEVEATLRGEPFALAPHARNNVARFEVR